MLISFVPVVQGEMFKSVHYSDVKSEKAIEHGALGVKVRWLISKKDGAERFAMRRFEVESGGRTPLHSHAQEHEVYVLEGEGKVTCEESVKSLVEGSVVYIPPQAKHCFETVGEKSLIFLCIIPTPSSINNRQR